MIVLQYSTRATEIVWSTRQYWNPKFTIRR